VEAASSARNREREREVGLGFRGFIELRGEEGRSKKRTPSRRGIASAGAETAEEERRRGRGRRSGRMRRGACGERREQAGDI